MKIKQKLTINVGLLFLMILLLATLGAYYINRLKNDTENILVANYQTLEYSRNMMIALDENISDQFIIEKFSLNLKKQQNNITEIGEKEATELLTKHFNELEDDIKNKNIFPILRNDLSAIMLINMEAIQRKSDLAKSTALTATIWIALSGTLCFLFAFSLLINLPNSIANPIQELSESIKQIAAKNYHQRVHFESHNEFGDLAKSFNTMATKLEEYNDSNLAKLMMEKERVETLINNMHDPVIGLDESNKIIFANNEALKITGLKHQELIGKNAKEISVNNDLVRSLTADLMLTDGNIKKTNQDPFKIYADNKESYFDKETIPINILPTGETDQKLIGHVILLKNITPFKELDFAKTNFIATVSHELKTPISSIKLSLQLLENKKTGLLNSEQNQLLDSIKEDSNRL